MDCTAALTQPEKNIRMLKVCICWPTVSDGLHTTCGLQAVSLDLVGFEIKLSITHTCNWVRLCFASFDGLDMLLSAGVVTHCSFASHKMVF